LQSWKKSATQVSSVTVSNFTNLNPQKFQLDMPKISVAVSKSKIQRCTKHR